MHCFIGLHVQEPLASSIIKVDHEWNHHDFPPADFHKHTNPHITIVPPFEIADVDQLITGLSALTAKFPQFDADYAQIEAFNHRIIHVEVQSNGIIDLRAQLYEFGKGIFHFQDEHPVFHPHTTVAYSKDPLTEESFSQIKTRLEDLLDLPQHQKATTVQLLGRHQPGEDYQTLANLPLASGNY